MRVDDHFDVLDSNQNYRGLPTGHWVAQLINWMVSEDPVKQDGPVYFTRGSGVADNNKLEIFHREGNDGIVMYSDEAVLIHVISSTADRHFYPDLNTDAALRADVREDIDGTSFGSIYFDYSLDSGTSWNPVIVERNFEDYIVETPLFELQVPRPTGYQSRIWDDVELTEEFSANAVTVGIFVMLTNFKASEDLVVDSNPYGIYKFRFGAVGDGTYYTSSVYDIYVNSPRPTHVRGMRKQSPIRPIFRGHPVWDANRDIQQPLI